MGKHVALLRGINVGGKNKLPMADLRAIFEELGCSRVESYIQSGNVVFEASATRARGIASAVTRRIEGDHGLAVPVQLRSAAELRAAVAANPFVRKGADEKHLSLMFLADRPTRAQVASFCPNCSLGEQFELIGREVYLLFPAGFAKTKFTSAYVDRALATVCTTRNWRTVNRLLAMLE